MIKIARNTLFCILLTSAFPAGFVFAQNSMDIFVDASQISRKLLNSSIKFNINTDTQSVLFPKWIPGIHGPKGPVENIGGFELHDGNGDLLEWERDHTEVYRFFLYANPASNPHRVDLRYICNQPSTNSRGVDSYGTSAMGIINWNTVLVYPEGTPVSNIMVNASLLLPHNWKHGSALPVERYSGDTVFFGTVTLEEFVDMPLICGINFETIELIKTKSAKYYLHLAADDSTDLPENDSVLVPFRKLFQEAEALFGRTHFNEYHLLLTISDEIPRLGLEHRNSSLNGAKAEELREPKWKNKHIPYLIPHEFSHAYCGKYRRPAGMLVSDFIEDNDTDLLWVYEGLDQHLGHILAVRCGFVKEEDFIGDMARWIGGLTFQKGRQWRSLRDTEISAYTLRGGSRSWSYLRRSQDYYSEGAMTWLEFDARIRNATKNKKSLDDFCRKFFSTGDPLEYAVPFDLNEIVRVLNSVVELPWDSLINSKVHQTQDEYNPEVLKYLGYKLEYSDKKPKGTRDNPEDRGTLSLYESLGLGTSSNGTVREVVPGSPADNAGLFAGVEIVGINGKKYSKKRLLDALKQTPQTGAVNLLVLIDDTFSDVTIEYDGGERYYNITRLEDFPDRLKDVLAPRVASDD